MEFAAPVGYKDETDSRREKTAAEDEEVRLMKNLSFNKIIIRKYNVYKAGIEFSPKLVGTSSFPTFQNLGVRHQTGGQKLFA